jgi:hypothetical protein
MLAGRDVNLFEHASAGTCCDGPSNPVTFNGTVMASRQVSLARDWADPTHADAACNSAQPPCAPVAFFAADTSCGVTGCWKFLAMDPASGRLAPDGAKASFRGCVTTTASPLAPPACPPGTRRVTHFQLTVNYDGRLQTAADMIPPGLPSGGAQIYAGLPPQSALIPWRDCGGEPSCP